jgi:hypothetical protein
MRAPFCCMPCSLVKWLQDGFTKHTHEMTWRCVAIVGFEALFFCKMVARWVYIYTASQRRFNPVTNQERTHPNHRSSFPASRHIFKLTRAIFTRFGPATQTLTREQNPLNLTNLLQKIESIIRNGASHCYMFLQKMIARVSLRWVQCSFVTSLQDDTKVHSMCWFAVDAMNFCNKFAR